VEQAGVRGFAVEWLAWRRSALVVATIVVLACAAAGTADSLSRWQRHVEGRTPLGVALEVVFLPVVAPWLVGLLCFLAAASWKRWRTSRRLIIAAAAIDVLPAFAIAMLPPSWLHGTADEFAALGIHPLRLALAAGLALRILGVLSAAFRASVVAKVIVPEAAAPGAIIAALTPVNLGFAVVYYVAINSAVQGWAFLGAWVCLVTYQLSYLHRVAALLRPASPAEARRIFHASKCAKVTLLPATLVLISIFVLTGQNSLGRPILNVALLERHWQLLCAVLTNYMVTLVAGVDMILHGVASLAGHDDEGLRSLEGDLQAKARSMMAADRG
jgi:hypothetical protein